MEYKNPGEIPSYRYLSYSLSNATPSYGDLKKTVEIKHVKSQESGDSCETYWIGFSNHQGTHIDLPAHFFPRQGQRIQDYSPSFWIFNTPQIISVELSAGQLLSKSDLHTQISEDAELVIFNSGWSKKRHHADYAVANPGIHPDFAKDLRMHYPKLRVLGFDWISVSSYLHRQEGREAHRAFLDPAPPGHPILILEDMNLNEVTGSLQSVSIFPWLIESIDSVPCTVVGLFI